MQRRSWSHSGPDKMCGFCIYMSDLVRSNKGRFSCEKRQSFPGDGSLEQQGWRFADDMCAARCRNFCAKAWSYLDDARYAADFSMDYRSTHGCYITTAVAEILGMNEDCHELKVFRNFRSTIAEENQIYFLKLKKYDVLGVSLATSLKTDPNRESIAQDLYTIYIKGTCKLLERTEKEPEMKDIHIERALAIYSEMIDCLARTYNASFVMGENVQQAIEEEPSYGTI